MGEFESRAATRVSMPDDLPDATTAASEGRPDGAIFRSDNGKRYRLRLARWVEVLPRKPRSAGNGAKK